jgi:hypothetical protein
MHHMLTYALISRSARPCSSVACQGCSPAGTLLSQMSVQVSEAEEQEQLQVDSIKEQEGFLTQAKRAAALARWRRLQASLFIISRGMHCKLAIVLTNPNTESHALCQPVNGMVLLQACCQLASNAFLPKSTLKLPESILLCPPLESVLLQY